MIVIKRGKLVRSEGIKMPDGEVLKSLEVGDEYKYLGVLEADNIKHDTMKNNINKPTRGVSRLPTVFLAKKLSK